MSTGRTPKIRQRRWITANIEQLDCAGCLCTIYQGDSILADPERGYLCASCGCDLEVQGIEG